jgi:hypothetical protein
MEATGDDFDSAIKLTGVLAKFGGNRTTKEISKNTETNLPWTGEFGGLFDEEWLDFWSIILLYLVHRATDFTYQTFPPSDKEIKKMYQEWHHTVKASS